MNRAGPEVRCVSRDTRRSLEMSGKGEPSTLAYSEGWCFYWQIVPLALHD